MMEKTQPVIWTNYARMKTTSRSSPPMLRSFSGPLAKELFLVLRPGPANARDLFNQTKTAYGMLDEILKSEGGSIEHVVKETVFLRNIRENIDPFLKVRCGVLEACAGEAFSSACPTYIGQPPIHDGTQLEISAVALIPKGGSHSRRKGRVFFLGDQKHLHLGGIHGSAGNTFEEAYTMFCSGEELLKQEGMSFHNVVRAWIYLEHMEQDYAEFNKARREFFRTRGVELRPASTGIEGTPYSAGHSMALSLHAIGSLQPLALEPMTTPTLNEAWTYGSDFSRGLKVVDANKVTLYISGTASVDEEGRTVHVGDIKGQIERMILNISTLLSEQKASFRNVVSAVTYLKRPSDAPILNEILRDRGLDNLPNALVQAFICRPDLLCEMEAIAVLPLPE